MKSAIRTLEEGLRFGEEWVKDPNCSEEQRAIKEVQIKEHKQAIALLQANEDKQPTEQHCNIDNVVGSVYLVQDKKSFIIYGTFSSLVKANKYASDSDNLIVTRVDVV